MNFKTKIKGPILHLAIDATGLKVYGESEWKVKKHGTDGKRRVWRKLHLAVDTSTHEIIAAELSLSAVADTEKLSNLLKQTRRKTFDISGDGTYDTRDRHAAIRIKRAVALIPPREGVAFWERGHPRNLAVGCQKLYGSNKPWKERYGDNKRSISETAMMVLLNTRYYFRTPTAAMSEVSSKDLGVQEIDAPNENYSYGADSVRDGVSLGTNNRTRRAVVPTENQQLVDLECWFRTVSNYPINKLNLKYDDMKGGVI